VKEAVKRAPGVPSRREDVTEQELRGAGVDLDRQFPNWTISDFKRYPVLSEGGWFIVIKHQKTLRSISRTPWHLQGPIEVMSSKLDI